MLAGVYGLGVGDAMASVVGVRWGKTRWVGSGGRTVEGTVGGVLSVVAVHVLVCRVDVIGEAEGGWGGWGWVVATVAAGLMEAWTSQIDNLVLPLYYLTAWNIAVAQPG